MTRVAAIDCGTNSIRLLIADIQGGQLCDVTRQMRIVRLGQGVDQAHAFAPQALARTFSVVRQYQQICADKGVQRIRFVATSATRDANNRQEFLEGVHTILGVTPQVISGQEEAQLSFQGAASAVGPSARKPLLVVDIGGGSTELVLGGESVQAAVSLEMGCVRVHERFCADIDEAAGLDQGAARQFVREKLDQAGQVIDFTQVATLIGLAGSVTTITAQALGLTQYDPKQIHAAYLSQDQISRAIASLLRASKQERLALGFMHPGRADVIGSGAIIWEEIVSRVVKDTARGNNPVLGALTSEHDILDGIALSLQ